MVDIKQSEHLVKKLKDHKIIHQYFVLHNANHTFNNINSEDANDIAQKIVNFIKHYSRKIWTYFASDYQTSQKISCDLYAGRAKPF